MEETVGGVYSQIPGIRGVAARAPREGGINVDAEAKALTQGFTKGMQDAWNTLRTGHSDLDSLYGRRDVMPREMIDFLGSVHGALKAPVKRAEFTRSLQKRFASCHPEWAGRFRPDGSKQDCRGSVQGFDSGQSSCRTTSSRQHGRPG